MALPLSCPPALHSKGLGGKGLAAKPTCSSWTRAAVQAVREARDSQVSTSRPASPSPREGGNSTLTSQGEVRAAHRMQGLGTLGARWGSPGQSRDPCPGACCWRCPAGPTPGQHCLEAGGGESGRQGAQGAGVPGGVNRGPCPRPRKSLSPLVRWQCVGLGLTFPSCLREWGCVSRGGGMPRPGPLRAGRSELLSWAPFQGSLLSLVFLAQT